MPRGVVLADAVVLLRASQAGAMAYVCVCVCVVHTGL